MENVLKILLRAFFKYSSKLSPKLTSKIAWSFFCKPRIKRKPQSTFETELLQQSKKSVISSGEYEISVYEWKNFKKLSDARTILLSHGWGGHALNFSHIISALNSSGFNVVAYDSPAHGNSSGQRTNLLNNTHALLAVASQFKNVYALIGHSFGNLANTYAVDLCRTNASYSQLEHIEKLILVGGPDKIIDIFTSFTNTMQLPNTILEIFIGKVEKLTQRKICDMSASIFLQTHIGQTLVIHDHDDVIVPLAEAKGVAKNSGAELFTTTGYGHFRLLRAKTVIDKIVNFLD